MMVVKSVGRPSWRWRSSRDDWRSTLRLDATRSTALAGKSAGRASSPAAARATEPFARLKLIGEGWRPRSGRPSGL